MPELMRSIADRLRWLIGNRRIARRFEVRLPCSVTPCSTRLGPNAAARPPALRGHTYDLSHTGLGLLMPAIRIKDHYLAGADRMLLITLELPTGPIQIRAVPTRYERLGEEAAETGFIIGVRIVEMSPADRSKYLDYLRALK
jgi:c-di-GMP-binding flagellar brake protein YcgR